MPVEPTLLILAIAVVANLVLLLVAIVPAWLGRHSPLLPRQVVSERSAERAALMASARAPEGGERWETRLDLAAESRADGRGGSRREARSEGRPESRSERRQNEQRPRDDGRSRQEDRQRLRLAQTDLGPELVALSTPTLADTEPPAGQTYDRIVRVVAMVFILAGITVVTVSGVWGAAHDAITLLLVVAALVVLLVHDVIPAHLLRGVKFAIEGITALAVATMLVLLTGRQASPFFLAFPLIVAGAALVVSARATLVLAALAIAGYIAAVALGPGTDLGAATVSGATINVTSLILLAYVAMVIARIQRRSRDAAIRMSTIDAMTGLFNRPYLFSSIEGEISRSSRTGRGFCLLMMDLDELKSINDRYGHFVGDRALRAVADVIRFGVRRIDVPARYGGDEFAVLLPETDPTGGYVLGEKIRQGVAELQVPGTEVRTSLSVGIVSYPDDGRTADELMISADRAMYASKRLGKNRVMGVPSGAGGRADAPV